MKIKGSFKDINNELSYTVEIGKGTLMPIDDMITGADKQILFSGDDPVVITSDLSDTFEHVYIRNATIKLISNFDLRDYVVAANFNDIPVKITRDNDVIFTGYVVPLQYNQDYAQEWNEFEIECVDKLGILEYIDFPPLLEGNYAYATPRSLINIILNECEFTNIIYNTDEYDHTTDTLINPILFIGTEVTNQDDWMKCDEVLNEIGKIYGCYYWQDGDTCKVENILRYDLNNARMITQDDYKSDDTNISVQEAYGKIKFEVDLSNIDEEFLDPFDDEFLEPVGDKPQRVITELIYKNKDEEMNNLALFREMCNMARDGQINWNLPRPWNDENVEVYDNYARILKNDRFDFGEVTYLNDIVGDEENYPKNVLEWLYRHPGKGAFIEFGKTKNLWDPKDHQNVIQQKDMKSMLLIQVNGDRSDWDNTDWGLIKAKMQDQIENNTPICSFTMPNAVNLIPNDRSTTNFLVIDGKITLNPIVPKTGPLPGLDDDYWEPEWDDSDFMKAKYFWQRGANTISLATQVWDFAWNRPWIYVGKDSIMKDFCVKKDEDDEGLYFQTEAWDYYDGSTNRWPYNQRGDITHRIAMPQLSPKYEFFKYEASSYDKHGDAVAVDTIDKISILACRLRIGDKYLVEDLDNMDYINWQDRSSFSWLTEDELPTKEIEGHIVKQDWFTLSINPAIGDALLGKEYAILDTVDITMNIDANGTAIPIPYDAGLSGDVEFEILGPYNNYWAVNGPVHLPWIYYSIYGISTISYRLPILAYVENIQITDLTMKLYSDNAGKNKGKNDKDLVYYSFDPFTKYTDEEEISCSICSSLTTEEANDMEIDYSINNSSILYRNEQTGQMEPWTGFTYDGENIKLEELRIIEQYNIWKRPRKIIETTIKLQDPEKAYNKNNYTFDYLRYDGEEPQIYRAVTRELNLKLGTDTCVMKELSDEQDYNDMIGSF